MACGDTAAEIRAYHETVKGILPDAEARMQGIEQQFQGFQDGMKASLPVAPNLLADTYLWSSLCGGRVNTPVDIFEAHAGSLFSSFLHAGTEGSGTIEVVTLDKLSEHGAAFGEDLSLATNDSFHGSSWRALIIDVVISKDRTDGGAGDFLCINQGCHNQSGWHRGQQITEAQLLGNVISQEGDIVFWAHSNMSASVGFSKNEAGEGWKFKHAKRTGFGGCYQPRFSGKGHMKIAIALPYVGTGDHGGAFFWADSIVPASEARGNNFRYTHHMQ